MRKQSFPGALVLMVAHADLQQSGSSSLSCALFFNCTVCLAVEGNRLLTYWSNPIAGSNPALYDTCHQEGGSPINSYKVVILASYASGGTNFLRGFQMKEFLSIDDIISKKVISPIPIDIIPNNMGINLCCVKGITVKKTFDGSLKEVSIKFKKPCYENKDGVLNEKNLK